jgi:hypothetical protein
MCNSQTARIFEIVFAISAIAVSSWVLWRARKGEISGFYFSGFWTEGKNAQGCAATLAIIFILLGIFVFLSATLYLDC